MGFNNMFGKVAQQALVQAMAAAPAMQAAAARTGIPAQQEISRSLASAVFTPGPVSQGRLLGGSGSTAAPMLPGQRAAKNLLGG